MTGRKTPYWRLSSFYLCYFALLGGIVPYWGLYLKSLEFDEAAIGLLIAILMGTRIVAPNIWGWLADRSGERLKIVRVGTFLTAFTFTGAFWIEGFWGMALLMLVFSFFWNAVLPQFEVITLNALGSEHNKYSRVRLWGSIGFILTVVGLGWLFDLVSMRWLVPILWGLMLLVWLFTLLCPHPGAPLSHRDEGPFLARVCKPEVLSFFAVYLLIQLSHGPYYTFYSLYMIDLGYTKTQIGLLWALGVVAEVVLFWMMHRLLSWTGLRGMVLFGLMICILRWLLIGIYPENLPLILLAQCFHAVTFGCLHAAGIALVQRFFGPAHQGQGQALFSSVGFGAGGALGALCSGQIWVLWGGAATFYFAAVVSLLALVIAWRGLIFEENRVVS